MRPPRQHLIHQPRSCSRDTIDHRLPRFAERHLANPAIFCIGLLEYQLLRFQLLHLPADGGVIATEAIRQFNDPNGSPAPYCHQQREEDPIELDPSRLQYLLVTHWLVHHADDIEQRAVKAADVVIIMCILHILVNRV